MTYIDGFVMPLHAGTSREAFAAFAEKSASIFRDHGATRSVECWGDDIPDGKVTDFRRSVMAADGETIVFAWVEWPDKATRDAGMKKVAADQRTQPGVADPAPFDTKRMIFGGFQTVVDA